MPLYVYRCASGHDTELIRGREVTEVRCSCGSPAQRQAFYAVAQRQPPPPKYRLSNFREAQAEVLDRHARAGTQPPDLMGAGVARGKRHRSAGVRP